VDAELYREGYTHEAYRNYVALKSLPFDSRIFSKELVKVK